MSVTNQLTTDGVHIILSETPEIFIRFSCASTNRDRISSLVITRQFPKPPCESDSRSSIPQAACKARLFCSLSLCLTLFSSSSRSAPGPIEIRLPGDPTALLGLPELSKYPPLLGKLFEYSSCNEPYMPGELMDDFRPGRDGRAVMGRAPLLGKEGMTTSCTNPGEAFESITRVILPLLNLPC